MKRFFQRNLVLKSSDEGMKIIVRGKKIQQLNTAVFICSLLASLVPRYISAFKIRLIINISLYTLAVLIVYMIFSRRFLVYKRIESYFIVVWFLFVILSLWRSEQFGAWAYYVDWTLTAVLFEQILYSSDRSDVFESVIKGLLLGLCIHLIIGFIEITLHKYFFGVSIAGRSYYGRVPVSIFHNPNDYVTYLITIFPFVIYMMYKQKTFVKKSLFAVIAVITLYMINRSESRSAFFALLVLGIALVYLKFRKSGVSKIYILLGFATVFLVLIANTRLREAVINLFVSNSVDAEATDLARINLIKNGLYFVKRTYGAGVGAGNLHKWLSEKTIYNIGILRFMHNWYIELLATFGVVFFALYSIFHVKIIINLIKRYNPNDIIWNLDNTMLVSFVAFSIISIASSSNIYSEWIWMYLIFMATYAMFVDKKYNTPKEIQK